MNRRCGPCPGLGNTIPAHGWIWLLHRGVPKGVQWAGAFSWHHQGPDKGPFSPLYPSRPYVGSPQAGALSMGRNPPWGDQAGRGRAPSGGGMGEGGPWRCLPSPLHPFLHPLYHVWM